MMRRADHRRPGRGVKHLNPRQGITTSQMSDAAALSHRVKHLNPRQGITTSFLVSNVARFRCGVKHLNPRQGITTTATDR